MEERLLLTVKEAAQRLALGRSATYALIQRGTLPSLKVGGSRRVAVADLVEFVERLRSEIRSDEGA
ncbi:MAG: helix-turn-helix domain-containing protein [Dehalococcoidia bacterium]